MSKTFEVVLGYRIFVTADSVEQVKSAGRALAKQMQVFPARDITVKEALPERSDGRWVVDGGMIQRVPLDVHTVADLKEVATFDGDLASVAEKGGVYTYSKQYVDGVDPKHVIKSKHGGAWLDVGAVSALMGGGK